MFRCHHIICESHNHHPKDDGYLAISIEVATTLKGYAHVVDREHLGKAFIKAYHSARFYSIDTCSANIVNQGYIARHVFGCHSSA